MEVTLLTENTRVRYTGDGVLKEFSYPFNPIDLSYVKVYKNLQPVTAPDVTISSGVVTFNTAPAEGDSIVIIREKPLTYDSGIVSKGIISPDSLDNLAVELLGQIQQVNEKLDRVPVYPIDTAMTGEDIINEFNQNVSDVKDAKISIEGKVEEINTIVSSGLTEINEATSEGKTQITEEKNAAINAVETSTAPLIERAETAATEAEASRANAEEWAKSVDAENIVHRTGDESVDGRKTLVQHTIFNREGWFVDTTGIAPDNPPSKDSAYGTLRWIVKGTEGSTADYGGGQELFRIQPVLNSSGVLIVATSYQYGTTKPVIYSFGCDKDGNNTFFNVPTPPAGDNSGKAANTNWVSDPAKSTNVVHRNGDEQIGGNKRFTNTVLCDSTVLLSSEKNDNQDVTPSAATHGMIFLNKSKTFAAGHDGVNNWIYGLRNTDGANTTGMSARKYINGVERTSYLNCVIFADGNSYAYCPTPAIHFNGTEIITTQWFNQKIQVVSTLPASPNANVYYFIPE